MTTTEELSAGPTISIAVENLVDNPDNPRTDLGAPDKLAELANSLKAHGNTNPCHVVQIRDGENAGKFMLLDGHRRRAAAPLGNVETLRCTIRMDLDTREKQIAFMLDANVHGENFTPADEVRGVQLLLDCEGMTLKRAAKAMPGKSEKWVRERAKLAQLSDEAKAKFENRKLDIYQALELLPFAGDEEAEARLIQVAHKPNDFKVQLAAEKELKAWRDNLPRLTAELQGAGIEIVERPEGIHYMWKDFELVYGASEQTVAEAVEKGHCAILHPDTPAVTWVRKKEPTKPWTPPEKTPEEIAAEVRRSEIIRGLELAAPVREKHLREVLKKPAPDVVRGAALALAKSLDLGTAAYWMGMDGNEDLEDQDVLDALEKLTADQLLVLTHIVGKSKEYYLGDILSWDNSQRVGYYGTTGWRSALETIYGYEWTEAEVKAVEYHREAQEAREAAAARAIEAAAAEAGDDDA